MFFSRSSKLERLTRDHAESLVRMLYAGVFEREADSEGLAHFSSRLRADGDLRQTLRALLSSEEFLVNFRRRHAIGGIADDSPELVRQLYRGLLGREPDLDGLRHHVENLRLFGELDAVLRNFIGSDEFARQFKETSPALADASEAALPEPRRKIHIYSNCQGSNLGRTIQALTGARPPRFFLFRGTDPAEPPKVGATVARLLERGDTVLMQPMIAKAVGEVFPELLTHENLKLFPSISFAAYQPDLCYVFRKGGFETVLTPTGPYNSSIAYYAWRNGYSAERAESLFNADVYEHLRFFDYWDTARATLLDEGLRSGLRLDRLLEKWRAQGCFMHSPNHPRLAVTVDIARWMLEELEIPAQPIDPLQVVWDNLAEPAIWPVYPEIARRYGVSGSMVFKGNNVGLPGRASVNLHSLGEFVAQSFASYEASEKQEGSWCHRRYSDRYRSLFEHRPGASSSVPVTAPAGKPTASRNTGAGSPYASLPAKHFWRQAVATASPEQVDPVDVPGFRIELQTSVATAGSCFAQHISRQLKKRGFNHLLTESAPAGMSAAEADRLNYGVYSARYGNLYTARQLLQLLRRARGEFVPREPAWQRNDGRWVDPFRPEITPGGFVDAADVEAARTEHLAAVRQMFETVEVFVFTLGLTEAWRSREDGAVFPLAPGVVAGAFDPARHEFVNFGIAEVQADLDEFLRLLRETNPKVRVLLTVSPVPLVASYEDRHVLASTTYSKSVLRVAAEETTRRHPDCAYFPSYEIVTGNFSRGAYFEADLRSVNAAGVDHVMRLFFTHYAPEGLSSVTDAELISEAEDNFRIVCEEERLAREAS